MAVDYYQVLGVDRDAKQDEIKRAFRRLARETHPDANPDDAQAERRFREIAQAYEVLGDPQRRAAYDRGGTGSAAAGGVSSGDPLCNLPRERFCSGCRSRDLRPMWRPGVAPHEPPNPAGDDSVNRGMR